MTTITAPSSVGSQMKSQLGAVKKIATGFDPAGGWGILKANITTVANAKASAMLHHISPIK